MQDSEQEPAIRNVLGLKKTVFMNSLGKFHFLCGYLAKINNLNLY